MNFTSMDIKKKIEELKAERNEQLAIEEKAVTIYHLGGKCLYG